MAGGRNEAGRVVEGLARFGYTAKGVVYGTFGVIALQAALGSRAAPKDKQAAFWEIGHLPGGKQLLLVVAAGLAAYVIWRLTLAILDPEHEGHGWRGVGKRLIYGLSAFLYAGLAWAAVRVAFGNDGAGESTATWMARVFALPFGQGLVSSIGAILIGAGIVFAYKAYTGSFLRDMRLSATEKLWACRLGRIGLTTRGVAFAAAGWFIIRAAVYASPGAARSQDEILGKVAAGPFGMTLLGLMGAGFVAYGLYCLARALFRRFPAHV